MKYEIIIIIALSVLLLISTFISTRGILIDNRKKGIHSLTKNGWWLIVTNFIILFLLILQFILSEHNIIVKEKENKDYQNKRDSILKERYDSSLLLIKLKFDSSNIKTITTVTEVLGRYGYMLDSTSQTLVRILRDSSKTKVILPDNPVLKCSDIKFTIDIEGNSIFKITLKSLDASSSRFNIMCSLIGLDSLKNYQVILYTTTLKDYDKLSKNMTLSFSYKNVNSSLFKMIFLRMSGTYKNSDQSKTFNIDDVYYYNTKAKTFGGVTGNMRQEIIDFLEKNTKEK